MKPRALAEAYIDAFCAGDIKRLATLLAPDLRFAGPLRQFDSRAAYLESLQDDPPVTCAYRVMSAVEDDDAVAVFWEYRKPGAPLVIAQLFKTRDSAIHDIVIVFDSA